MPPAPDDVKSSRVRASDSDAQSESGSGAANPIRCHVCGDPLPMAPEKLSRSEEVHSRCRVELRCGISLY